MKLDLEAIGYLSQGCFWKGLWEDINEDHCWGMAAELSYYFLLAFFPFLIFLSALVGLLPVEGNLLGTILNELRYILPGSTLSQISELIASSRRWQGAGSVLLWMALALWAASLALNGMVGVLNRAYRIRDRRSFVSVRLLSILVTVGVSLLVISSALLLLFGDDLIQLVLSRLAGQGGSSLPLLLGWFYRILRWLLILGLLNLGVQSIYYWLPARRLPWRTLSAGGLFAIGGFLTASIGFRYYVNNFSAFRRMYGGLGDVVVLMIWFYLTSLFLLAGGEMDSRVFRLRRQNRAA